MTMKKIIWHSHTHLQFWLAWFSWMVFWWGWWTFCYRGDHAPPAFHVSSWKTVSVSELTSVCFSAIFVLFSSPRLPLQFLLLDLLLHWGCRGPWQPLGLKCLTHSWLHPVSKIIMNWWKFKEMQDRFDQCNKINYFFFSFLFFLHFFPFFLFIFFLSWELHNFIAYMEFFSESGFFFFFFCTFIASSFL